MQKNKFHDVINFFLFTIKEIFKMIMSSSTYDFAKGKSTPNLNSIVSMDPPMQQHHPMFFGVLLVSNSQIIVVITSSIKFTMNKFYLN